MRASVGVFLIVASLTGSAAADLVVDQQQTDASTYMAAFGQTDLAQSFQQSHDNVAGAGIFLRPGTGTTDNVTIGLWDDLPNAGGSLLAGNSGIGTQGTWFDVYWTPVTVIPGDTLFLVFSGNSTLGIMGSVQNPYPYGQTYANAGYSSYPTFDYTFRTYYDDSNVVVPVPGAVLLGVLGLSSAGCMLRRRTAQ